MFKVVGTKPWATWQIARAVVVGVDKRKRRPVEWRADPWVLSLEHSDLDPTQTTLNPRQAGFKESTNVDTRATC